MYVNSDWNIFPDVDGWIWSLLLSGLNTETHSLPSTCPVWVKESMFHKSDLHTGWDSGWRWTWEQQE